MESYPGDEYISDTVANGASSSQIVRWLREGVDLADLQLQPVVAIAAEDHLEPSS